jgi:hypothetical protein
MTPSTKPRQEIIEASQWRATGGADKFRSPIPQVRERFGLTLAEAASACREAHLIRARAH